MVDGAVEAADVINMLSIWTKLGFGVAEAEVSIAESMERSCWLWWGLERAAKTAWSAAA